MFFRHAACLIAIAVLTSTQGKAIANDVAAPPAPPVAQPLRDKPVTKVRFQKATYLTSTRDQVVDQINMYRRNARRNVVAVDPQLQASAQQFAEYMARTQRFSHTADGLQPGDRAVRHGYSSSYVMENIAYQYASGDLSRRLVSTWLNSPGHAANIYRNDVTDTGVGIAQSPYGGAIYAVQVFGRSRYRKVDFQITNQSGKSATYQLGRDVFTLGPNGTRYHSVSRRLDLLLCCENPDLQQVDPQPNDKLMITGKEDAEMQLVRTVKETVNTTP